MRDGGQQNGEGIGDLVSRLIEDGKSLARAEAAFVKAVARHRAERARTGVVLLGTGILLLVAGFVGLIVGAVLALMPILGPFLAGLAVLIATGLAGFLLVRAGARRLAVLSTGTPEERAAIAAGEADAA